MRLNLTVTPTKRVLSQQAVLARVPVSRTTLWRMERAGDFPKRIQISANRIGWLEADVDAWLDERKASYGGND
jgi:prophage regulatory protein